MIRWPRLSPTNGADVVTVALIAGVVAAVAVAEVEDHAPRVARTVRMSSRGPIKVQNGIRKVCGIDRRAIPAVVS